MRRLLQITSTSTLLLTLILAFTFIVTQAQTNNNHNQLSYEQGYGYNQILMGKVISVQTGQPVANAEVTIMTSGIYTNSGKNVRNYGMHVETTIATNQDGTFLVKNLSPGAHTIKVRKNNYQYWQNTVRMSMRMNNYRSYGGLSAFGYYRHGYNYPYSYGYRRNNNERQPPFHGFFRPDSSANGFFHGVFSANNTNNNNNKSSGNNKSNYRTNSYSKGLFLIIRLQKEK